MKPLAEMTFWETVNDVSERAFEILLSRKVNGNPDIYDAFCASEDAIREKAKLWAAAKVKACLEAAGKCEHCGQRGTVRCGEHCEFPECLKAKYCIKCRAWMREFGVTESDLKESP